MFIGTYSILILFIFSEYPKLYMYTYFYIVLGFKIILTSQPNFREKDKKIKILHGGMMTSANSHVVYRGSLVGG